MLEKIGEAAFSSVGFFWKTGWAFVLGYLISSMIQTFVSKDKMVKYMGDDSLKSVSLSALFGGISSSCSFAALAAGKSLFKKGAHFIPTLAFLFASTNLVVELGILIYIFLGWQFVIAEIIGGILLILIMWGIVKVTYPEKLVKESRDRLDDEEKEEFNWKEKIKSKKGWYQVGMEFVMNWQMVWKEIIIGFTVAGIMKAFVPESVWKTIFLANQDNIGFWKLLENVLIAPFAAALTFIGSMGNIPIATIIASSGVTFGGIMAFIYSDLMVPPIVKVNAKYYGKKTAMYIAGVFFIAIVITALTLHGAFSALGILPDSAKQIMKENPFKINYTFWFNMLFIGLTIVALGLNRKFKKSNSGMHMNHHHKDSVFMNIVTYASILFVSIGFILHFVL
ncbi:permease (plasmid) [Alkalihalobacillus hwajinpoensis]|uniref:permease n=1 Tax=Guptibacillus hwajinpoensis TaxID=208199 RepID=UPI0018846C08|nr:permease [Pseudalkalibacillus hwajinpoensis]MBF0706699.1 permease [Pseudalkalibacillus hwajinpoensis]